MVDFIIFLVIAIPAATSFHAVLERRRNCVQEIRGPREGNVQVAVDLALAVREVGVYTLPLFPGQPVQTKPVCIVPHAVVLVSALKPNGAALEDEVADDVGVGVLLAGGLLPDADEELAN